MLEIQDLISSFNRREKIAFKDRVDRAFLQASVTARTMFPPKDGSEPPHQWDYYPDLYEKEHKKYEQKQMAEQLADFKEKRRAYYKRFNEMRKQHVKEER